MDIRKQGVIRIEPGIIHKNGIYFHSASAFAQQHLFYGLWGAEYICNAPYRVNRKSLNAFLLFFINTGELHFEYRGQKFTAHANDIVLIDCNHPHCYYATESVHFYWFHFHGAASAAYCNLLWQNNGALFSGLFGLKNDFIKILSLLSMSAVSDDSISCTIHHLLALLNTQGHSAQPVSSQILQAQEYLKSHINDNISIADAAQQVAMSRYHFSRRFRAETGITPQEYLLEARLTYAKKQLAETNDSIEQIALDCAFCSSSNFIRSFKKYTGMTPYQFRRIVLAAV